MIALIKLRYVQLHLKRTNVVLSFLLPLHTIDDDTFKCIFMQRKPRGKTKKPAERKTIHKKTLEKKLLKENHMFKRGEGGKSMKRKIVIQSQIDKGRVRTHRAQR